MERFVIVESGAVEWLLSDCYTNNNLEELKRLYRHLREDTRLIGNFLRPNNFEIINCAGTNVTVFSSDSAVLDETICSGIRDLTRPRLKFIAGLGATLEEAGSALQALRHEMNRGSSLRRSQAQ